MTKPHPDICVALAAMCVAFAVWMLLVSLCERLRGYYGADVG